MTDALREAAQAVLDRWDSPQWKWTKQGPTADLMAALRAALSAPAAVPPGMVLVPVEMTEEMRAEAWRAAAGNCNYAMLEDVYRRMLSVASQPPAAQPESAQPLGYMHSDAVQHMLNCPAGSPAELVMRAADSQWCVPVYLGAQPVPATGAQPEEPMEMALCESQSLVLRVGQPYVFKPVGDCEKCAAMAAAAFEAYGAAAHTGSAPAAPIDAAVDQRADAQTGANKEIQR